jgi:hypothetical protein
MAQSSNRFEPRPAGSRSHSCLQLARATTILRKLIAQSLPALSLSRSNPVQLRWTRMEVCCALTIAGVCHLHFSSTLGSRRLAQGAAEVKGITNSSGGVLSGSMFILLDLKKGATILSLSVRALPQSPLARVLTCLRVIWHQLYRPDAPPDRAANSVCTR